MNTLKVIAITNASSTIIDMEWLKQAEAVHRQLRPHLPKDYVGRMKTVFASGAEMAIATHDNKEVLGISVFRILEKTYSGRELYCDDLITDEARRSTGVGRALMRYMETLAWERECDYLTLDSGTHRQQAHKFYFREGLTIASFHFVKLLKK